MLDLFASNISVIPAGDSSNTWEIGYDLTNKGNETAKWFDTDIYQSKNAVLDQADLLIKSTKKVVLTSGQLKHFEITQTLNPTQGDYLIFKVDSKNRNKEINEANNLKVVPIAGVDLSLKGGKVTVSQDSLTVSYTISNDGKKTSGSFSNAIALDGKPLSTFAVAPLTAKGQKTLTQTFQLSLSPGTHKLSITADSLNQIKETNEKNNQLLLDAIAPLPTAKPDLVIEDLWVIDVLPNGEYKISKKSG